MRQRTKTPIQEHDWSGDHGPRVLIEDGDGAMSWALGQQLRRAGFRVATCDGPDPQHHVECPLVSGGGCDLVAQADAVVSDVRMADGGAAVLDALRENGRTPLVRHCVEQERRRDAETLAGVTVVPFPSPTSAIVEALDHALGRREPV